MKRLSSSLFASYFIYLYLFVYIIEASLALKSVRKGAQNACEEFVQFLIYAFGEDLEWAWEELDDDDSGELSEEEWFAAVERIGHWANSLE